MITSNSIPLQAQTNAHSQAGGDRRFPGTSCSVVSWGAIGAGAAAGASLSLILMILGVGLGLSLVSPWANQGITATSFGVSTIIWLILTQVLSSGMGGYLAGRLRAHWADTQTDEVYFRDTAHGFLAWALATLGTAVLLASLIGSILNSGLQASASVVGGVANSAAASAENSLTTYLDEYLFSHGERTGRSQQIAEQRVADLYTRAQTEIQSAENSAKEATNSARKASAHAAL